VQLLNYSRAAEIIQTFERVVRCKFGENKNELWVLWVLTITTGGDNIIFARLRQQRAKFLIKQNKEKDEVRKHGLQEKTTRSSVNFY